MIDPAVLSLFSKEFLEIEMQRHGIREIKESWYICHLKDNPMVALPESEYKTIYIDINTDWEAARRRLNWPGGNILSYETRSYATPLILENEEEARLFVFFHEAKHIEDPEAAEWQCDAYSRTRILEHRKGKG